LQLKAEDTRKFFFDKSFSFFFLIREDTRKYDVIKSQVVCTPLKKTNNNNNKMMHGHQIKRKPGKLQSNFIFFKKKTSRQNEDQKISQNSPTG
jgi:hypothetical protein